ncbi:MAG: hypothetical protein EA425_06560, partial [Puniceicoccaceae bacterium]
MPPFTRCILISAVVLSAATPGLWPANDQANWFPFGPPRQDFTRPAVIDLRHLNEDYAGQHGFIAVADDRFVHGDTGEPVRFWSANISTRDDFTLQDWRYLARLLAKYGVNHLRIHGSLHHGPSWTRTDQRPEVDPFSLSEDKLTALMKAVAAMKDEGIYTHLSFYFPLWFRPPEDPVKWPGYDGEKHPFAAIFFNENLIAEYKNIWRTALTRENPHTGLRLIDDPAVMGVELINEDSLFFATFRYETIPEEQMAIVEGLFADWLAQRYGTLREIPWLEAHPNARDALDEGRLAFGDLREMADRRSPRDQDTVRFLYELQRDWYLRKTAWFRDLGFKGLITASNWITANDAIYDGIERATYLAGDFIDHHRAYFGGRMMGEDASWSIRKDHRYYDRSQLRFDAANPSQSRKSWELTFVKPKWNDKPTMISETAWMRPNRNRTEAAGIYAAYGALHDIDAICHFTLDSHGRRWTVQPRYVMQAWTLQSPSMMGQFPAAALIYRQGLVATAPVATDLAVNIERQLNLEGMPRAQVDGVDILRMEDDPGSERMVRRGDDQSGLRDLVGRTRITLSDHDAESRLRDLSDYLDLENGRARSLTGELEWDWVQGYLRIDAPKAQGFLLSQPIDHALETADLTFRSDAEIINLMLVALDDTPISTSQRMLLQVMTEERTNNF